MNPKIIKTSDGSSSLYREDIDENYHSVHGAINEANHVFISKGLDFVSKNKSEISIFEMGFGTGLNALVTHFFALDNELKINYTSIEKYPLMWELCKKMNYLEEMDRGGLTTFFENIHTCNWGEIIEIESNFNLHKIEGEIETLEINDPFDLIYFDAFGPRAQSDMWSIDIFKKMHSILKPNGVFVTYCAKGQVRRDLESVGFKMERLPGPPGKREMLRGIKEQ